MKSLLPYEPRRSVPWGGLEVFAVVVLYAGLSVFLVALLGPERKPRDIDAELPPAVAVEQVATDDEPTEHSLITMIRGKPSLVVVIAAIFLATVAAPITEELFFRLLLQGWLEKVEKQSRAKAAVIPELFPGVLGEVLVACIRPFIWSRHTLPGLVPMLLQAAIFAALHARTGKTSEEPSTILRLMILDKTSLLLSIGLVLAYVRLRRDATDADFGVVPAKLCKDIGIGLATFFIIAIPIYSIQVGISSVLPKSVAADPVPLLLFALVLGFLYFRTHRIVPGIVMHTALNATSMAALLAGLAGQA